MAGRIHLTAADLSRVRVAPANLAVETAASLVSMRTGTLPPPLARWRQSVLARLSAQLRLLLALSELGGPWLKLLAPAAARGDPATAIDVIRTVPEVEVAALHAPATRQLPDWARRLADGDRRAYHRLADSYSRYFHTAIAPISRRIESIRDNDFALRQRLLADGGLETLLNNLNPALRWEPPVLHVQGGAAGELRLDGTGLSIMASCFLWQKADMRRCGRRNILVHSAMGASPARGGGDGRPRDAAALSKLLGRTRYRVLVESRAGKSTTELATILAVSPAAVSQHTAILRQSGLLTTQRDRNRVIHTASPLGVQLIAGARQGPVTVRHGS